VLSPDATIQFNPLDFGQWMLQNSNPSSPGPNSQSVGLVCMSKGFGGKIGRLTRDLKVFVVIEVPLGNWFVKGFTRLKGAPPPGWVRERRGEGEMSKLLISETEGNLVSQPNHVEVGMTMKEPHGNQTTGEKLKPDFHQAVELLLYPVRFQGSVKNSWLDFGKSTNFGVTLSSFSWHTQK